MVMDNYYKISKKQLLNAIDVSNLNNRIEFNMFLYKTLIRKTKARDIFNITGLVNNSYGYISCSSAFMLNINLLSCRINDNYFIFSDFVPDIMPKFIYYYLLYGNFDPIDNLLVLVFNIPEKHIQKDIVNYFETKEEYIKLCEKSYYNICFRKMNI